MLKQPVLKTNLERWKCFYYNGHFFINQSVCRRGLANFPTRARPILIVSRQQELTRLRRATLQNTITWVPKRHRSEKSNGKGKEAEDDKSEQEFGYNPPLYDGKPPFWARWTFLLLALDVLFTGFSADMVMRNWTMVAEETPSDDRKSHEKTMVLRPLWQRLSLATFELAVGAAAGAFILVSRDRTVWRLLVQRLPTSSLPPSRAGMRSPPSSTKMVNVLSLESGSGRTKRFLLEDCTLSPGRDLSELFLSINGIRGNFIVGMNGARVLGHRAEQVKESKVLSELLRRHEKGRENEVKETVLINSVPRGERLEDVELAPIRNLRVALARAWSTLGGKLRLPKPTSPDSGWVSGPIVEG